MVHPGVVDVYFEVIENGDDPIVEYVGPKKCGFGMTKSKMIETLADKFVETHGQLRLMQVKNLSTVVRHSIKASRGNVVALQSYQLESLFSRHSLAGIPIRATVALLGDVMGLDFGGLCKEAGVNRNYLNNTLKGVHAPSEHFKELVIQKLGIDPWQYAEWLEPDVISEEIVPILEDPLSGQEFIKWLKRQIKQKQLSINTKDAPIHIVDEGVFLLAPKIFKCYLSAIGVDESYHSKVSRRFSRLRIHLSLEEQSIHSYQLLNKSKSILNGWVIAKDYLFEGEAPTKNRFLARCVKTSD